MPGLIARLRRQLYPETARVAGYYWLRTVYESGYGPLEWLALNAALERELAAPEFHIAATLSEMRECLQAELLHRTSVPAAPAAFRSRQSRPPLPDRELRIYFIKLLNEWLPRELASRLLESGEGENTGDRAGIPALEAARTMEALIVRDRVSTEDFDAVLDDGFFSPASVYPGDYELLRDVVLCLTGRMDSPPLPILPAVPVWAHTAGPASATRPEAFRYVSGSGEIELAIGPEAVARILGESPVRLPSCLATMDGRWWHSDFVTAGASSAIIYRPHGRVVLDYSHDHVRFRAPWPDRMSAWHGPLALPTLELFGRRWTPRRFEQDSAGAAIEFECAGILPVRLTRTRPASVDMAWDAVATAVADSMAKRTADPIDALRNEDLIPVARAIWLLAECARNPRAHSDLTRRFNAVRFHLAALDGGYGRIPSSVVPRRVRFTIAGIEGAASVFDSAPGATSLLGRWRSPFRPAA